MKLYTICKLLMWLAYEYDKGIVETLHLIVSNTYEAHMDYLLDDEEVESIEHFND